MGGFSLNTSLIVISSFYLDFEQFPLNYIGREFFNEPTINTDFISHSFINIGINFELYFEKAEEIRKAVEFWDFWDFS